MTDKPGSRWASKLSKWICCRSEPKFPRPYNFHFVGKGPLADNQANFESNYLRTSKYTPLSFFPKALILQFKRLANFYFLIIAILQSIPAISPLLPLTAWLPFIVVITISMSREGYEDYLRYKEDRQTNYNTATEVMRDGKFTQVNWSQVVIGDVVRTEEDSLFPADLLLLSSPSEKGAAFIETASLDGEKNLKPRSPFPQTVQYNCESSLCNLEGDYFGEIPDIDLHKFSARVLIGDNNLLIRNEKQLLYRGTRLKNTKWIHGLAVQTGRNTKIVMNSKSNASKMSQTELKVNLILVAIFIMQLVLCFLCGLLYGLFRSRNESEFDYISWPPLSVALDSFLISLSFLVLLNTMIPISLIVSIQIVKMAQKVFIESDQLMHSQLRQRGATVKSASLNEELGQIEYLFSDKTGTLTMNMMQFKIAVIQSKMYGDLSPIMNRESIGGAGGHSKPVEFQHEFQDERLRMLVQSGSGEERLDRAITVKDKSGNNEIELTTNRQIAIEYLKALSLAHEVIADVDKSGVKVYQGPSPDEITLVDAARSMGYQFMNVSQALTTLSIMGRQQSYPLLNTFGFTSDRKRMSVVFQDEGVIKMYMKGADSIVKKRLAKDNRLDLDNELSRFSRVGLRTLLIAMRTISKEEYEKFNQSIIELKDGQEQQYEKLVSELESNMYLIGATAVLDRLQDDVPEMIRDLLRASKSTHIADIKVWMLTGDKMETAENIAKSCHLIQDSFEVLKYQPGPECSDQRIMGILRQMTQTADQLYDEGSPKALLIEGGDLTAILQSEQSRRQLAELSKNCEAVVCCRLLPSQKAEVVKVVRQYLNKITLAIGDGANDVPMIKQAHIGIGLYGEEGMSAVQSSDYALPEFRMLWRLLLVHGRWNYIRIAEMILYFFYKNMLFTLPQLLIAFFNGYSAQTIFDHWYISLYNLAFTSLPLLFRAVLEQDVNYIYKIAKEDQQGPNRRISTVKSLIEQDKYLPAEYRTNKYLYRLFPKLYFIGQENCIFNWRNYAAWMAEAVLESLIITYFCYFVLSQVSVNQTGINSDYWLVSLTIFSTVIVVVTFKLATHTRHWTKLLFASIVVTTFLFYFLHMWLTNFTLSEEIRGTTIVAWSSFQTYLVCGFCICGILFVDGMVLFLDFERGGYASRMREVIKEEKINSRSVFSQYSLSITEGLTAAENYKTA